MHVKDPQIIRTRIEELTEDHRNDGEIISIEELCEPPRLCSPGGNVYRPVNLADFRA